MLLINQIKTKIKKKDRTWKTGKWKYEAQGASTIELVVSRDKQMRLARQIVGYPHLCSDVELILSPSVSSRLCDE